MRGQKDIMARRGRQRGGQWPFVLGACSDIFLQVWVVAAKIPLALGPGQCIKVGRRDGRSVKNGL